MGRENDYFTPEQLNEMQRKPFGDKVQISVAKILQIFNLTKGNVYVAFSGGKDSCVLLDLVAKCWTLSKYKDEPLTVLFANTRCEYAGMIEHIHEYVNYISEKYQIQIDYDQTDPDVNYREVVQTNGYPVVSKLVANRVRRVREDMKKCGITWDDIKDHVDQTVENAEYLRSLGMMNHTISYVIGIKKDNTNASRMTKLNSRWLPLIHAPFEVSEECCYFLKKDPQRKLEKKYNLSPILGEMAVESNSRRNAYMSTGCVYETGKDKYRGKPMGFWTEQDVYKYIKLNNLPIFKLYGEVVEDENGVLSLTGVRRTGCKLCMFGCAFKSSGIHQLKDLEPQTARIALKPISEGGFGYGEVIKFLNEECKCKIDLGE